MLWYRNLQIYRISPDHQLSAEAVNEALAKRPFVSCGAMDMDSCGWTSPARHEPDTFAFSRQDALLISIKTEEKVLPAAVIKDELDVRVLHIETEEKRKVGRKEQKELKDRITDELLPRAFTRSFTHRALIDLANGLVIVDAASAAKAEYLLSTLRETLGSLPTRLITTELSPAMAMTDWLATDAPDGFSIGQTAELKVPGDEGSIARFKRQVMDCEEVRQHLDVGKIVTQLEMAFTERLTFTLTEALEIKSLTMLDVLKDEIKDMNAETQDALFESQMALLIGELRGFIPALLESLGGESVSESPSATPSNAASDGAAYHKMSADDLYAEAVKAVVKVQRSSISFLQRHLRIGYNRAAHLIEQMEADGIVSKMESNGSRTVLAQKGGER